jgi:hypothetical protein
MPKRKRNSTKSKEHANSHSGERWVSKVKTVSTYPPEGTFTKEPQAIADTLADKKVSPKGIGSGIRMVQYFINRGGKGLSATRRKKLERAKEILREKLKGEKKKKERSPASKANRD